MYMKYIYECDNASFQNATQPDISSAERAKVAKETGNRYAFEVRPDAIHSSFGVYWLQTTHFTHGLGGCGNTL